MHLTKTEVMAIAPRENIERGQEVIEYVDQYMYLGQLISIKGQYFIEVEVLVTIGIGSGL